MGNRANIIFTDEDQSENNNFGVYIHWNGGPESVYAFFKTLASYGYSYSDGNINNPSGNLIVSSSTQSLRFSQLVSNYFNTSKSDFLNIQNFNVEFPVKNFDGYLEENGLYVVHPDFSIDRYVYDENSNVRQLSSLEKVVEFAQVLNHKYWQSSKDDTSLLEELREVNDSIFLKKFNEKKLIKFYEYELPIEKQMFKLEKELNISIKDFVAEHKDATVSQLGIMFHKIKLENKIDVPKKRGRRVKV